MVHELFDLEYWKTVFPVNRLHETFPEYPYWDALGDWDVTSPFHLVVNEYLKEQNPIHEQKGEGTPVDIFVWAYGEPGKREVTKMGGLPYFPKSRPWPRSAKGETLEFLAQICFKDSLDICGSLPGDVLVILQSLIRESTSLPHLMAIPPYFTLNGFQLATFRSYYQPIFLLPS